MTSYLKATIGAVAALLTGLITGYDDSSLAAPEILGALLAAVTTFGAVYAVPNKP